MSLSVLKRSILEGGQEIHLSVGIKINVVRDSGNYRFFSNKDL